MQEEQERANKLLQLAREKNLLPDDYDESDNSTLLILLDAYERGTIKEEAVREQIALMLQRD
jgi:hypothetical protein